LQSYYQATRYMPTLSVGGVPYGAWPEIRLPGTVDTNQTLGTDRVASGEVYEGAREQITTTLRKMGFSPKGRARVYQKLYP
jgi:hypothetical protein